MPWNEAYHTLGVWWKDANNIQFYLDGEPAGSVSTTRNFTRSLNIIWDLWTIDATWSGGITQQADLLDDSINTMRVDWIHTYRLVGDGSVGLAAPLILPLPLEVFPNPAQDQLSIRLFDPIKPNATVQLSNQLGQIVKQDSLFQATHQLSLQDLPAGVYVVKVQNGEAVGMENVVKR
ncbi:MAG: T9SS type A sorting domain-containing protein [Bacteroidota bacterium]